MKRENFKSFQFALLAITAALVVVFFFQTQVMDLDRHTSETQDILRLKHLDTLLGEEALKATSLQLSHYDGLVSIVGRINTLITKLEDPNGGFYGVIGPKMDQDIDQYIRLMKEKIDLIEVIKSRMAIVRNTLNFLPTEIARITQHSHNALDIEYHHMLTALLSQNINATSFNLQKFQETVGHLQILQGKLDPTSQDNKNIERLIFHANANMKANSDTLDLFNEFSDLPTAAAIERIFVDHSNFALNRIKTADQFRIVLLILSMFLFIGLGRTLYNLNSARNLAQRSSQQFRDAVESIAEGFAFFDSDGKLQFWNKTFERLHANCKDTLQSGISFRDFFKACTETGTYIDVSGKDTSSSASGLNQSYTVRGQDDTWILASDSPMGDGGTACVRIDITENKRAEAEMRKLSRAVEQSPASVIITDLNGDIVYVNPKFCETTGYAAEEALGKKPSLVKSGERTEEDYQELWDTISAGNEWHGEFHNKRKDGSLFWEYASISPIKNENGQNTHYLGIKEDITEQKKNLAELVKAKETAEFANHAKTQFLANMSHELRTPLNAIIGFSEILKEQMFGPLGNDQYHDYSLNIFDSGQHLLNVINDILDVSRIEIGTIEIIDAPVDMKALCRSCIEIAQELAEYDKVTLQVNISDGLDQVTGDEIRIKQIIINLLNNAIKFTPAGGRVELNAFINDRNEYTIQVIDTGIGISKDQHSKILEPFEQVGDIFSRDHEGSGMGLFLVKSFIQLHGGTFDIESELGKGSTFTFSLPSSRIIKN